jgi:phage baseplate assembly protein W
MSGYGSGYGLKKYSFKSVGELEPDNKVITSPRTLTPYGIKTPLAFGKTRTGIFDMYTDPRKAIKDNLRNLLLTNRGERLGRGDIGASLRRLVSEKIPREDFDAAAMRSIQNAVGATMPFVELQDYASTFNEDQTNPTKGMTKIVITVIYSIPQLSVDQDGIEIVIQAIG